MNIIENGNAIGAKCCQPACGKIRGKYAQPWGNCPVCGRVICATCLAHTTEKRCHSCWRKAMDEEHKRLMSIPCECPSCHKMKLPKFFKEPWVVANSKTHPEYSQINHLCKVCDKKQTEEKLLQRKKNAIPGLVEVNYGERPVPTEDGGHGHAYFSSTPLNLGDIVQVPQTWLGEFKGDVGPNIATVVSTYSDYQGQVSRIVKVVTPASKRKPE